MVPADPRTPFDTPVHVVRPRLPDLEGFVERLRTIWASGWLTNGGAQHIELELRLQQMLGVPSLSLFNNGTMALLTACRALSLHGEVITTPFTFPATPHVLSWLGATPVFADIDRATLTIDPDRIEALITPRTTGILAVHVYGTPCDVDRLEDIARRHRLKLVYDAAHAFGVRVGGRGIGTFGDASAFSFHATKVFHTAEGGALACRDPELAAHVGAAAQLRHPQRGGSRAAGPERQDERAAGGARPVGARRSRRRVARAPAAERGLSGRARRSARSGAAGSRHRGRRAAVLT